MDYTVACCATLVESGGCSVSAGSEVPLVSASPGRGLEPLKPDWELEEKTGRVRVKAEAAFGVADHQIHGAVSDFSHLRVGCVACSGGLVGADPALGVCRMITLTHRRQDGIKGIETDDPLTGPVQNPQRECPTARPKR